MNHETLRSIVPNLLAECSRRVRTRRVRTLSDDMLLDAIMLFDDGFRLIERAVELVR